jgi:hypothetical protein
MTGEMDFVSRINFQWFVFKMPKEMEVCEALAEIKAYAAYNSIFNKKPENDLEKSLTEMVDGFAQSMNWDDQQKKYAYQLACKQITRIAIEKGYLSPP